MPRHMIRNVTSLRADTYHYSQTNYQFAFRGNGWAHIHLDWEIDAGWNSLLFRQFICPPTHNTHLPSVIYSVVSETICLDRGILIIQMYNMCKPISKVHSVMAARTQHKAQLLHSAATQHILMNVYIIYIYVYMFIWVRSRMCGCIVTWFCYHLIATRQQQLHDLTHMYICK